MGSFAAMREGLGLLVRNYHLLTYSVLYNKIPVMSN